MVQLFKRLGTVPNKQLRRTMGIIKILIRHQYGLTLEEISTKLNQFDLPSQSVRTIQRDIKEIELLG